jgi:hypothetical protein
VSEAWHLSDGLDGSKSSPLGATCIFKAYQPSMSIKYILEELGFDLDEEFEYSKQWLASCGGILSADELLTKDSVVRESNLAEKASSLI